VIFSLVVNAKNHNKCDGEMRFVIKTVKGIGIICVKKKTTREYNVEWVFSSLKETSGFDIFSSPALKIAYSLQTLFISVSNV